MTPFPWMERFTIRTASSELLSIHERVVGGRDPHVQTFRDEISEVCTAHVLRRLGIASDRLSTVSRGAEERIRLDPVLRIPYVVMLVETIDVNEKILSGGNTGED